MWLELYPHAQPMTQEKVHAVSWKELILTVSPTSDLQKALPLENTREFHPI